MNRVHFDEDRRDQLREILNVAMGRAGADLATLLDSFVELSVPEVRIIEADRISDAVIRASVFKAYEKVMACRQSFSNASALNGEALVFFNRDTRDGFSDILGLARPTESGRERDFMLELTNLIVVACLTSTSRQLFGQDASFSHPRQVSDSLELSRTVYQVLARRKLNWSVTLLAKITFLIKDKNFQSDLLILMSEKAIEAVHRALEALYPGNRCHD